MCAEDYFGYNTAHNLCEVRNAHSPAAGPFAEGIDGIEQRRKRMDVRMTERFLSEKRKGEVGRDPVLGVHFVLSSSIRESSAHRCSNNPRRVFKIGFSNGSGKCMEPSVRGLDVFCASHISPWAVDEKNRLNPENGLCLSTTSSAAFDRKGPAKRSFRGVCPRVSDDDRDKDAQALRQWIASAVQAFVRGKGLTDLANQWKDDAE